jgi:UDP-N-acetylglucosamine 2-epimerase (non-hydrolysing)
MAIFMGTSCCSRQVPRLALTDLGGIQEETLHPGRALRDAEDNTERPETVDVGVNVLTGANAEEMLKAAKQMLLRKDGWTNPFGDGRASNLILDSIVGAL